MGVLRRCFHIHRIHKSRYLHGKVDAVDSDIPVEAFFDELRGRIHRPFSVVAGTSGHSAEVWPDLPRAAAELAANLEHNVDLNCCTSESD